HAHGDLGRAGRADDDVRPIALEHDRRDHRAEARLARREAAGAARARIENAHAAVVHEAEPARDHARGHAERVGHGHAAALAIDHRDVGGVAGRRAAFVEAGHVGLPARADLLGEAGGVLAAREALHRHIHEPRIAHVAVLVDRGALYGPPDLSGVFGRVWR